MNECGRGNDQIRSHAVAHQIHQRRPVDDLDPRAAAVLPGTSWTYWTVALRDPTRLGPNAGTANQSVRGFLLRLGPEGLPSAAALAGRTVRQVREFATGAREQLRSELGPEFDELRKPLEDLRGIRDLDEGSHAGVTARAVRHEETQPMTVAPATSSLVAPEAEAH